MIKGSTFERLEYAAYVRDTARYVEDLFLNLQTSCRILYRYYKIQSLKRELSPFEIAATNLASLTAYCSCHIGSLVYIWLINEALPYFISKSKPIVPTHIVSIAEISELFLKYPKSVLEATVLRANISYGLSCDAMKAYKDKDSESLSDILSTAEISSLWPSFMLMNIFDEFRTSFQNTDGLDVKGMSLMIEVYVQDIVDAKEVGVKIDTEDDLFHRPVINMKEIANALERVSDRLEAGDTMLCRDLIGSSIILSRMLYESFKANYGEYDPIVETMNSIISNAYFIGIENMYKDKINVERIEGYLTRLGNIIPVSIESVAYDSVHTNEATGTTLIRFLDEVLVFDVDKRVGFINKYLTLLTEFFGKIDSAIALYAFACLFYPMKPKRGNSSKDKITATTRLSGGIQWKDDPGNINEFVNGLTVLNPGRLKGIADSVQDASVSSAKRYEYLVKLTHNKSQQYSWIKDFIEDYWPIEAQKEFMIRYKVKK